MLVESFLLKIVGAGFSKNASTVASMVGRQVLDRGVKEVLDRALAPALKHSLANLPILEQALLGLDLTKEEAAVLESFLNAPAFQPFIQAVGLITEADEQALAQQRAALAAFLTRVLPGKPQAAIENFAHELLEVIAKTAPGAWQTATELGIVGQSWRADAAIQTLVSDRILNARRQLEERIASTSGSFADVDIFAQRYKRSVRFATGKLRPQSLNESTPVPIDRLYVEPLISLAYQRDSKPAPRNTLLAASTRSVVLGNPGGGKSTLAGKLCYDVCSDVADERDAEFPELAALVTLRDYAQYRRAHPSSIVEYLELHSKSEFQIEAPPNAFKLLLLLGRLLVVFDGLDELIEVKDRSEICSAIEHFALEYPIAPILVTSREVGYEQAPLDQDRFTHFKLSPFGQEQLKDYAAKWFALSCPTHQEAERFASAFIAESAIVQDIRSNPLMLGLLCNLYRQDGFLPRNRPEVYQRCADLLFTKWDRHRGIKVTLRLEHRLRPAMSYLAHWIYSDEQLQGGVPENQLAQQTSTYLRQWVEDDAEADSIAREFVEFFSGRAWVFTDTGSDRTQRLYQFTHRTFLEFFTAEELLRLYPTAETLFAQLIGKIRGRSWDVVCQLAFQLMAERTRSHNSLVEMLCAAARAAELPEKLNILSFLARTMELLYPMPPARREAVRLCTQAVFLNALAFSNQDSSWKYRAREILTEIMAVPSEAQKINASEVKSALREILESEDINVEAKAEAVLLAKNLPWVLSMHLVEDEIVALWNSELLELDDLINSQMDAMAETNGVMAVLAWERMHQTCKQIWTSFGLSSLFSSFYVPVADYYRAPLVSWMASEAIVRASLEDETSVWLRDEIKSLRKLIIENEPLVLDVAPMAVHPALLLHGQVELLWPEDTDEIEGILLCVAVMSELDTPNIEEDVRTNLPRDLVAFWFSHSREDFRTHAHALIDRLCKTQSVKDKLHAWVQGETSFTQRADGTSASLH